MGRRWGLRATNRKLAVALWNGNSHGDTNEGPPASNRFNGGNMIPSHLFNWHSFFPKGKVCEVQDFNIWNYLFLPLTCLCEFYLYFFVSSVFLRIISGVIIVAMRIISHSFLTLSIGNTEFSSSRDWTAKPFHFETEKGSVDWIRVQWFWSLLQFLLNKAEGKSKVAHIFMRNPRKSP